MAPEVETPLEDMMVAMDVVDTLRHRQELVDRELDADVRREKLIAKLREIYKAQGIEVSDQTLAEGVDALEKDRFSYRPPTRGFSVFLAKIYVARGQWLKPLLLLATLIIVFFAIYYYMVVYPRNQALEQLPDQAIAIYKSIEKTTKDPVVINEARAIATRVGEQVVEKNLQQARQSFKELVSIETTLEQQYQVRILSKPGEYSGIWRIPEVNSSARNYYLIVEAIGKTGKAVSVMVVNEENNQREHVKQWGLRVDQRVFQQVMNDKKDDGIIQNNIVGVKSRGALVPKYKISTSTKVITQW